MLYFAYGSNLSLPRFRSRLSNSEPLFTACLIEHQFRFHKCGRDGSAKADALFTGKPADMVYGLVYRISEADRPLLDEIEDEGVGYEAKPVVVTNPDCNKIEAFTYVALHIDKGMLPFDWYQYHVVYGAKAATFPLEYIQALECYPSSVDYDDVRARCERLVYMEK